LARQADAPVSEVRKPSASPKPKTVRPSPSIPIHVPTDPKPKPDDTVSSTTADATAAPPTLPSSPAPDNNPLNRPVWKPRKQAPKVQQPEEEEEAGFLDHLRKPRVLGALGTAAVALICLGFYFTRTERVRVVPAHGRAVLGGKPMPGALIVLQPTWTKEPVFPQPRAVVNDDGSFVLGTYNKDDGAPVGEYRVSVQWLVKRVQREEVEGSTLPTNVLPPRYGKFDTSGLTAVIQEGDNDIPAFQLTR
jgi:hypothetical protein